LLLSAALMLSGAACVNAHIFATDAGSGGQGSGGTTGAGGSDVGLGGDTGAGGSGLGGMGAGGSAAGGIGDAGTGGAIVDAGTGGMNVDAPYDGPTGTMPYAAGQLVITEIMADSNDVPDESGEWFELYNPSTTVTYDLFGCLLYDSNMTVGNQDVVAQHVLVAPNSFVTMARFGDATGGFIPTYDYHTTLSTTMPGLDPDKDVKFKNSGDQVGISCGVAQIDLVQFTTWTIAGGVPNGRSYSLDPSHYSATANDVESNWCVGTTVYHRTDLGTPGQTNPSCACEDGATDGGCGF
jgi:hypothetical protein